MLLDPRGLIRHCAVGCLICLLSTTALADTIDRPPPGAMALSTVLTRLEQQGYTPIVKVELKGERWEITGFKTGEVQVVLVDPNSGDIIGDTNATPAQEAAGDNPSAADAINPDSTD